MTRNVYLYIFIMALTTYLVRALPLVLFKKEITGRFAKSFLYYVPYACLAAMTFPAMLSATGSYVCGIAAFVVALVAAWKKRGLLTVAVLACLAAFVAEQATIFF